MVTGGHNRVSNVIFIAFCGHNQMARDCASAGSSRAAACDGRARARVSAPSIGARSAPFSYLVCTLQPWSEQPPRQRRLSAHPALSSSAALFRNAWRLILGHTGHDDALPWPMLAPERAKWAGGAKKRCRHAALRRGGGIWLVTRVVSSSQVS